METSLDPPSPRATPEAGAALRAMDDDALDTWILARLAMAGVDLSVLPENDPPAPADRVRILRSARNFLRTTLPALEAVALDPLEHPPLPSPSTYRAMSEERGAWWELR